MKTYDRIKDMLCDELDEIAKKNELTSSNLEIIYKSVDILKDISTINAMEQEYGYSNDGYSQDGYSNGYYARYPYYMYDDAGASYARGRTGNVRRDSMGRYSRDGHMDDGYSRDTASELQRMMDNAKTDKEREALRMALSSMNR